MGNREQALLDRIAQLEEALGIYRTLTGKLRSLYGLEPLHAQMLGMLYTRDFVTRDGLYTVLYGGRPECEWPEEKILDVQFCRLRKSLRKHAEETGQPEIKIITQWGEGWRIDRASKAAIRAALERGDDADGVPVVNDAPPLAPTGAAEALRERRLAFLEGA